jgi:hypothetical protein
VKLHRILYKSRMSCHVKILEVQRLACYVPPGTVNAAVDIIVMIRGSNLT